MEYRICSREVRQFLQPEQRVTGGGNVFRGRGATVVFDPVEKIRKGEEGVLVRTQIVLKLSEYGSVELLPNEHLLVGRKELRRVRIEKPLRVLVEPLFDWVGHPFLHFLTI